MCNGDGSSSICPKGANCLDGLVIKCTNDGEVLNVYQTDCVLASSLGGAVSNGVII